MIRVFGMCLVTVGRFRKFAILLLFWIMSVNMLLAFFWLHPTSKPKDYLPNLMAKPKKNIVKIPTDSYNGKNVNDITTETPYGGIIKLASEHDETLTEFSLNLGEFKALNYSDFDVIDSKTSVISDSGASFVLIIPRLLGPTNNYLNSLNRLDKMSLMLSGKMLRAGLDLDGLACLPRSLKASRRKREHFVKEDWKRLFNSTWCNFAKRDWSIQIRNSGLLKKIIFKSSKGLDSEMHHGNMIQLCNIFNGPFLLRKEHLHRLKGFKQFGRISLLDFFLRSNGKLKIGKFGGCFYSDSLFYLDRGPLEGLHNFPEYSDFGVAHGVLRIIMEDRIEWTKCVANDRLCKEKPYTPPSSLPQIGQPICCSVVLGLMLKDIVKVFTNLGIKYRLLYGTLLGAVRSEAIIPYVHDLDFAVDDRYGRNWSNYDTLQPYFKDRYTISSNSFMGMPRLLPLMPPHLNINTSMFFDGELDLEGKKFFSEDILSSISGLLPVSSTDWRTRGYTDFYQGWDVWWNGSSTVKIDGLNYTAMKMKEYEVALWYGKNWRTPILKNFESQSDAGAV